MLILAQNTRKNNILPMNSVSVNRMKIVFDFALNIVESILSIAIYPLIAFVFHESLQFIFILLDIPLTEFSTQLLKLLASVVALITSCFASWLMYEKARKIKIDNELKKLEIRRQKMSFLKEKITLKQNSTEEDKKDIDNL